MKKSELKKIIREIIIEESTQYQIKSIDQAAPLIIKAFKTNLYDAGDAVNISPEINRSLLTLLTKTKDQDYIDENGLLENVKKVLSKFDLEQVKEFVSNVIVTQDLWKNK